MMTFGWRPDQSCYKGAGQESPCKQPTWWYLLMGLAVVAGISKAK